MDGHEPRIGSPLCILTRTTLHGRACRRGASPPAGVSLRWRRRRCRRLSTRCRSRRLPRSRWTARRVRVRLGRWWSGPCRLAHRNLQDERCRTLRLARGHAGQARRRLPVIAHPRAVALELRPNAKLKSRQAVRTAYDSPGPSRNVAQSGEERRSTARLVVAISGGSLHDGAMGAHRREHDRPEARAERGQGARSLRRRTLLQTFGGLMYGILGVMKVVTRGISRWRLPDAARFGVLSVLAARAALSHPHGSGDRPSSVRGRPDHTGSASSRVTTRKP